MKREDGRSRPEEMNTPGRAPERRSDLEDAVENGVDEKRDEWSWGLADVG